MRGFVWILIIVAVLVVVGVGILRFGYNGVTIDPGDNSTITVEINEDWPDSGSLILGATVETSAHIRNPAFLPLYVPALEHALFVGDEFVGDAEPTSSMWLGPRSENDLPVSAFLPRESLPAILLELILSGGSIDITVESTGSIAGISFTKTTTITYIVRNPVLSLRSA